MALAVGEDGSDAAETDLKIQSAGISGALRAFLGLMSDDFAIS